MKAAQCFDEAVPQLVSKIWEEGKTGRVCFSSFVQIFAQHSCRDLILLHEGYNLIYIFNVLYGTYYVAKLMDTWKGLLEFMIFHSQLQHPWADILLFVIGCTQYITKKEMIIAEFQKKTQKTEACGCTS